MKSTEVSYQEIRQLLLRNSSMDAKKAHDKFIPGNHKSIGVRLPVINELASQYKEGGFALAERLWNAGVLEEKLLAAKILGKIAKKDPDKALALFHSFSESIDDWAVCDSLGIQSLKPLVTSHSLEIFTMAKSFNHMDDPWKRRLSLVMVEWYTRKKEFHPEIKVLIANLERDQDYYVKKAVVWIKRNLAKGR